MPIYNDVLLVEEVNQFLRDRYKKSARAGLNIKPAA
jgi:hypothetical protein